MGNLHSPSLEPKYSLQWKAKKQRFAENVNQILLCYNVQTKEPIQVLKVNYILKVQPGMVITRIEQNYQPNESNIPVELAYMFCLDENAAVTQMIVELGDKKAYGIIKEIEVAKKEYQQGKQDRKTMVYSEQNDQFPQIKIVKIGCLQSKENLKITFEYIQPLKVYLNKFWQIIVSPMIDVNLISVQNLKNVKTNYPNLYAFMYKKVNLELQKLNYTQNITIDIDLEEQIIFAQSPTHSIQREQIQQKCNAKNSEITRITLDGSSENYSPEKQFILFFTTQSINQPKVNLTYSNNDAFQAFKYCATITFVPKLFDISVEDAYQQYIDDLGIPNQQIKRSRYIFFIDRSGSMKKKRIQKAKEALILFLKSLPLNSEFNIVSFGSQFKMMAQNSMQYCYASLDFALNYVDQMEANYGGTDIYTALKSVIYEKEFNSNQDVPLNVFLLTDGEDEPGRIIDIIQKNTRPEVRIYTLGIGEDCNQYLVKRIAEVGNGKHHFSNNSDIDSKVIDLLEDSLAPYLKAIRLTTNADQINQIIPDPESIISLKKNEELTIHVLFSSKQSNENLKFEIQCYDPQQNKQITHQCNYNIKNAILNENFHKLAGHKMINLYQNAEKYGLDKVSVKYCSSKLTDLDIQNISLQYQILSSKTAFVCEVCQNEKVLAQEIQKKIIAEKSLLEEEKQFKANEAKSSWFDGFRFNMSQQEQIPEKCCCEQAFPRQMMQYQDQQEENNPEMNIQMVGKEENNFEMNIQMVGNAIKKDDQIELNDLIRSAQPDGRFILNETMKHILRNNVTIFNNLSDQNIYTILALFYLEFQYPEKKPSWKLIFKKGVNYLSGQQVNYQNVKKQYYDQFQAELANK